MFDYDGPILINFDIESDYCFPLVPPGKGLDEMILSKDNINQQKFVNQLPPS